MLATLYFAHISPSTHYGYENDNFKAGKIDNMTQKKVYHISLRLFLREQKNVVENLGTKIKATPNDDAVGKYNSDNASEYNNQWNGPIGFHCVCSYSDVYWIRNIKITMCQYKPRFE